MMPAKQLHRQLEKSLGADWRSKLAQFDETPIAAASIGQVGIHIGINAAHLCCLGATGMLAFPYFSCSFLPSTSS